MKILYIHTYYKERGGEDSVFENEVRMMKEGGRCAVETLIFHNKGRTALKFLFFYFNPFSFIRTWRAIGQFKPDIVHVHNWFFGASPSVFIAARWRRVPVVHTIHNFRILCPSGVLFYKNESFTDSLQKVFPREAIRKKVYRDSVINTCWLLGGTRLHYFFRTWQHIDRFICLSDASRRVLCDSFLRIRPEKISVKPHFFHFEDHPAPAGHPASAGPHAGLPSPLNGRTSTPDGRTENFLYVGRLSPEKGIGVLLDAFSKTSLPLRIIGDGPLRPSVVQASSLHPGISYLGYQEKEQILRELRSCTALVLATTGFEQFGMVIIEAFYCGTPVIVPDQGSPAELVTPGLNGLHFRSGSPDGLLEKLKEWNSISPEIRHRYAENATRTYSDRYTRPDNADQLLTIYKSMHHEKNADTQFSDQHRQVPGLH
jgi:glycosyltransferase involved in cell wall biosynthesis